MSRSVCLLLGLLVLRTGALEDQSDAEARELRRFSKDLEDTMKGAMGSCKGSMMECMKTVARGAGKRIEEVMEEAEKMAGRDAMEKLRKCATARGSALETCHREAKEEVAKSLGIEGASKVSRARMEKALRDARGEEFRESMKRCARDSDNSTELKECRDDAKEKMMKDPLSGGLRSKAEMAKELRDNAIGGIREIGETCAENRENCRQKMMTMAAQMLGKEEREMSTKDFEMMNRDAATDAAKGAVEKCITAKSDDPDATCENPWDKFKKVRDVMGKNVEQRWEESRMKMDIMMKKAKDMHEDCYEEETREDAKKCMDDLRAGAGKVRDELFKTMSAKQREAKAKVAEMRAAAEVIWEKNSRCVREASNDTEKASCRGRLQHTLDVSGLSEPVTSIFTKARSSSLAKAVKACDASKKSECLRSALKDLEAGGMEKRKGAFIRKKAAVHEAVNAFAECIEVNGTDSECDDWKPAYAEMSGITVEKLSDMLDSPEGKQLAEKIKRLGQAVVDGESTEERLMPALEVAAEVSGTECKPAFLDKFKAKVKETSSRDPSGGSCSLVDGAPMYVVSADFPGVSNEEIGEAADNATRDLAGTDLGARRLSERRLSTVDTVYANQASETCVSTDTSCGNTGASTTMQPANLSSAASAGIHAAVVSLLALLALGVLSAA